MGLTLVVITAAFSLLNPGLLLFQAQPEALDMQQRVRVAADALIRDLNMAGAGRSVRTFTPVVPGHDSVTISYVAGPHAASAFAGPVESHRYYFDAAASQLRHYDGLVTDVPVVDHVVALAFNYFGDPDLVELPLAADPLRIRKIRVSIRVQAARPEFRGVGADFVKPGTTRVSHRYLPDLAVTFRVSPRNLNLE